MQLENTVMSIIKLQLHHANKETTNNKKQGRPYGTVAGKLTPSILLNLSTYLLANFSVQLERWKERHNRVCNLKEKKSAKY